MSPSPVPADLARGFIIPIGGAEDKFNGRVVLRRFVDAAGGSAAHIVVIATASEVDGTGRRYVQVFEALGCGQTQVLDIDSRKDAERPALLAQLDKATGVFFTGGNQLRLSTILGGTSVATCVRRLNAHGVHVAGTSAGAAFVSEHMIAFGAKGSTPVAGSVTLAPGLGLTNRVIVDQHFRQRDRLGRLLAALAYNPFAVGIGLDEDTAAFIGPDNVIEVAGTGGITVVDASNLEYSNMASVVPGQPVEVVGVRLHVLTHGARYDLESRRATPAPLRIQAGP
jgi:cyanophycinase